MPLYSFGCRSCALTTDDFAPLNGPWPSCPRCGGALSKQITLPQVIVPDYHKAINHAGNARHKAFMESDDTKAKLRSGEYEPAAKGDD